MSIYSHRRFTLACTLEPNDKHYWFRHNYAWIALNYVDANIVRRLMNTTRSEPSIGRTQLIMTMMAGWSRGLADAVFA